MKALDSLTLQYFYQENFEFINGAIVQKIQLPTRHEIILNIRNLNEDKAQNRKLYININPKYPHICFIDEKTSSMRDIEIPSKPPMFCMQLRKYLNGSKIKDFKIIKYERILELYFDYFDEIGSLTRICLAFEFMGKHSNIILYNAQNKTIIGAMHNISSDKSSIREIYGGINYIYPPLKQKLDILNVSYSTFFEIAKNKDIKVISDNFYYLNQTLLNDIFEKYDNLEDVFNFLQNLQNGNEVNFLVDFWGGKTINQALDNYFSNIMFNEILANKKSKLKKYLSNDIKKLSKTISFVPDDKKADKYKRNADLIMSHLYYPDGLKEYDIELDETLDLNQNAQKYYQMYKKARSTYEHSLVRFSEAKEKSKYLESIVFNIENASSFDELKEIKNEIIDLGYIQDKKEKVESNIEKLEYKGYEIYIGKNNKQNDFLISKIASGEDLWFHGQNFPSSHVILKVANNKKEPTPDILEFCAKLTKENSKARDGGKASIIMTKRKNLKKPPNTYLGYVTYKNEIEIVI
ncbi:MAG: NFACT family protein [Candidatus Gastranaerophilales bacterium]|nr:NFACT family protein [Candidatus Gastranaerophilales bacterium]